MKYDLKSVAVRFDTSEQRREIERVFKANGFDIYSYNSYSIFKEGWLCYIIDDGDVRAVNECYQDLCDKTIISYSDFMHPQLENGMVVELRNGDRAMYINTKLMGLYFWCTLDNYNENYTNKHYAEFDIIKIYKLEPYECSFNYLLNDSNLTLLHDLDTWREQQAKATKKQQLLDEVAKLNKLIEEME